MIVTAYLMFERLERHSGRQPPVVVNQSTAPILTASIRLHLDCAATFGRQFFFQRPDVHFVLFLLDARVRIRVFVVVAAVILAVRITTGRTLTLRLREPPTKSKAQLVHGARQDCARRVALARVRRWRFG